MTLSPYSTKKPIVALYDDCAGLVREYIDFDLCPSDNVEKRVGVEHRASKSSVVQTNTIYYWKSGESWRLL